MAEMTYSYPWKRVAPDYALAGIGLVLFGVLALLPAVATLWRAALIVLALVFLGFGVQTALRHRTRYRLTEQDIRAEPRGPRLRWGELTEVKLAYYATQREARDGRFQLTLIGGGKKLAIDSRLDGFVDIARWAATSASANALALDPTTLSNFSGLHISLESAPAREGGAHHG